MKRRSSNETALYLVPGNGWAQSNRFDVNFIARNGLGIHLPDPGPAASMTWVETSMDLNGRDAIIESPDGFYRFSFVTPNAPPIGGGLASSLVHILDGSGGHKTWQKPKKSRKRLRREVGGGTVCWSCISTPNTGPQR
jgi:hypothetical protein